MNGLSIRPMRPDDWEAVAAIYLEGIVTNNATFNTTPPSYAEWDAGHKADCRLIAELNGRVAGWAALTPFSAMYAYRGVAELSLYIGEAFRGQGVGESLLRTLIAESEAAGYWTLQSKIFTENTASLALHEKCGFRILGVWHRIGQDALGRWRDVAHLERRSSVVCGGGT